MKKAFFFALFVLFATTTARAEVRLWPVPEGEPVSDIWSLEVYGEPAGVLTARTADPPFEKYDFGGEYGFVSLDADEPVVLKFREKTGVSLDDLTVRPLSLGLTPTKNADGSFELTIDKPCQISVEPNGRKNPILVFVNPLEKDVPNANAPNVRYFGPGVHNPEGGKISLKSNETLYLAPGAVVRCGVEVNGENVRICGRGVIDSNPWKWREGPTGHVVSMFGSKNVSLEGVIIRGASHWTVVPVNCDGVFIDNIKICGGRVQNDDGINPCNSRNVRVVNTFIRSDDDCMALKGLNLEYGNCEDIAVENCVFWCDRARTVLMGHESRAPYMRRITFKNIDIIRSQARNFLLEPGERMILEDVVFDGIRFETGPQNALNPEELAKKVDSSGLRFDVDTANRENWLFVGRPVVNRYMQIQEPGHIKNVVIRNISVVGPTSYAGFLFSGSDESHRTDGLTIENVEAFGKKIGPGAPTIHLGDFLDNVEVK